MGKLMLQKKKLDYVIKIARKNTDKDYRRLKVVYSS